FYERITDSNGVAKLTINLQPDTYILTAYNLFNGEASSNIVKVLSTIEGNNLTKYFQNASRYNAKFYNEDGTPLAGVKVIFNINGVFYEKTTNSEGIASLNINLRQGEYIITATNPINGQMYSNIVTILPTLVADNLVMYYRDGSQFKVTALDGQGNPASGVDISMNVNGIFYYRTTKADGTAYLTINLIPGEYIITSYFGQESISNLITIFNR
ncbi:MAG: adhesin, partial [Methanobrevibacter sp.]|nr:adhesin [Methanobrevibacter sp.]